MYKRASRFMGRISGADPRLHSIGTDSTRRCVDGHALSADWVRIDNSVALAIRGARESGEGVTGLARLYGLAIRSVVDLVLPRKFLGDRAWVQTCGDCLRSPETAARVGTVARPMVVSPGMVSNNPPVWGCYVPKLSNAAIGDVVRVRSRSGVSRLRRLYKPVKPTQYGVLYTTTPPDAPAETVDNVIDLNDYLEANVRRKRTRFLPSK